MMRSVRSGSIERNLVMVEVRELGISLEQVTELHGHLLGPPGQQHPQVLHRGPHHAVVEVDEVRAIIGPQHVAGMTVAVQPQRAVRRRLGEPRLDQYQRIPRNRLIRGLQVRRDPPLLQQVTHRLAPEHAPVEPRSMMKLPRATDRVDAREKPPHPLPLLLGAEFRPAPTLAPVDRIAKPAELEERPPIDHVRRHHRHLGLRQFERKRMFLEDRGRAPPLRPVELHDDRHVVLAPHLVDAILVAVQREHASVATMAERLDGLDDDIRRQCGIGMQPVTRASLRRSDPERVGTRGDCS